MPKGPKPRAKGSKRRSGISVRVWNKFLDDIRKGDRTLGAACRIHKIRLLDVINTMKKWEKREAGVREALKIQRGVKQLNLMGKSLKASAECDIDGAVDLMMGKDNGSAVDAAREKLRDAAASAAAEEDERKPIFAEGDESDVQADGEVT